MIKNLATGWNELLKDEFQKDYFTNLQLFVENERKLHPNCIFPAEKDVFKALNLCDLEKIKVVILGQDPYPTRGFANGLCFSVESDVSPLPRSLQNILKEIKNQFQANEFENGDLTKWAKQGVLLLNAVLTVQEGLPNSHSKRGWEKFTDRIIQIVSNERDNVVFLLWGKQAHLKTALINNKKHLILKLSHPSPLGYQKKGTDFESFKGNTTFIETNEYLKKHKIEEVYW
jgi:uracil-DNA glycosylase